MQQPTEQQRHADEPRKCEDERGDHSAADRPLANLSLLAELDDRRPLERAHPKVDGLVQPRDPSQEWTAPDTARIYARSQHVRAHDALAIRTPFGHPLAVAPAHQHTFDDRLATIEERARLRAHRIDGNREQEVAATLGGPHERHATPAPAPRRGAG